MSNRTLIKKSSHPSKSEVNFPKYAIILNVPKSETNILQHQEDDLQQKASSPIWAKNLLPRNTGDQCQDVGQLSKVLEERICFHAGSKVSVFTGQEIIQENASSVVPLIYRVAVENFAKNCRTQFKIIHCPNKTKLSSDWKPSLTDILIARKHQVIVVNVKEPFLYHVNFAYAILRQLNHEWKIQLPQSVFYPRDVCTRKICTREKSLIMLTPSMPDGDLDLCRITNQLQKDLLTMFKQNCMNALKNTLRMRDLGLGECQEIVAALARIRVIYRRVQRGLQFGQYLLIGPESCPELIVQMGSIVNGDLATADTVLEMGQRIFDLGPLPQINSGRREHSLFAPNLLGGGGDEVLTHLNSSSFSLYDGNQNPGNEMSVEERLSKLDETLKSQFERIQVMLSATEKKCFENETSSHEEDVGVWNVNK